MAVRRIDITRKARELLRPRVLFRPYGREPKSGLDCIGVVTWVGRVLWLLPENLVIPPYAYPPQIEAFELFNEHMAEITAPAVGAVVILKIGDNPQHCGILDYADNKWKVIGVDVFGHRPWVTITPLELDRVWKYYDFQTVI